MGGRIVRVVLEDGTIFKVGITRPIKYGENYLHLRIAETTHGPETVFGVDTWLGEEETFSPGLIMIRE